MTFEYKVAVIQHHKQDGGIKHNKVERKNKNKNKNNKNKSNLGNAITPSPLVAHTAIQIVHGGYVRFCIS